MSDRVQEAVRRALVYLEAAQLEHGEWPVLQSPEPTLRQEPTLDSTPFATALILHGLRFVGPRANRAVVDKGCAFLLGEMRGEGLWTYWSSHNPAFQEAPPDIDDISCISYVLGHYGHTFTSARELILDHRNEEGLFYTWLLPRAESSPRLKAALEAEWHPNLAQVMASMSLRDVVDTAVNANALLFLGESDPRTHASRDAVVRRILAGTEIEGGDYYLGRIIIWYFVARAFANGVQGFGAVRDHIVARVAGELTEPTPQALALAICTLFDFDAASAVEEAWIEALLESQASDGSWPRETAYIYGDRESGSAYFYGSESLTTGFCLEALARYSLARGTRPL